MPNASQIDKGSSYFRSLLLSLVLGICFVWGFSIWRDSNAPRGPVSEVQLLEHLEVNGISDLKWTDWQGKTISGASLAGKVVLVNLWASWCAPCLEEFPSIVKLLKAFGSQMVLVAISEDTERKEIEAFLKAFPEAQGLGESVKIVWDSKGEFAKQFQANKLPETYLFDMNGKLRKKVVGGIRWYTPESVSFIKSLGATPSATLIPF